MKLVSSKVYQKIALVSVFFTLLLGSTACLPLVIIPDIVDRLDDREHRQDHETISYHFYFKTIFLTNEKDVYMVHFSDAKEWVYFVRMQGSARTCNLSTTFFDTYPSKSELLRELSKEAPYLHPPHNDMLELDSIGIYRKADSEKVAMFYSKALERKGKVSSTNYTNPYLKEHWKVALDEQEYQKMKDNTTIGSITFTLKKLK